MPSNRELTAEAELLAKQLGTTVKPQGLNNHALTALRDRLRGELDAKLAPHPEAPAASSEAQPTPAARADEPQPAVEPYDDDDLDDDDLDEDDLDDDLEHAPVYRVAPGKALTTVHRTIVSNEAVVTQSDFETALEYLVTRGHLVKS